MASNGVSIPDMYGFEDFFNHSRTGYIITDPNGKIVRCNPIIKEWMGQEDASLIGKPVASVFTVGGRIYHETHIAPLLKMQDHFDEVALEIKGAAGLRVQVLVNGIVRKSDDGLVAFIRYSFFKATDRRKFEQNLMESRQSAETSLEKERELSALRELFIAVLGHDLRNPLVSIKAGAELLKAISIDDNTRKVAGIILTGSVRMNDLINDVLDLARGRLGAGMILDLKPVSLEALFRQITEELKLGWPTRVIESDFSLPGEIVCDGSRIAQLFSNLLVNAIKHGAPDYPIRVQAKVDGGSMTLEVANQGVPIPSNIMDQLFEPFTRTSKSAHAGGLGLGLYIASEIAKAHHGKLTVSSTTAGTSFVFVLPESGMVQL